ncbi:MAG TPA: geranylgeranylglyceryl/heptaprenylglyceryl phosphate synthase, partial [Burkholderiales bacterium]|nr:geranylgeranylglyceryl/heptaprenylglyceryl phosphate synthase [Burkholderiales bacterium]
LAAQYFGMKLVYLEGGSGAHEHVPPPIVRAVKTAVTLPVMVGGGIREGAHSRSVLDAGADIVVTGTIAEKGGFDRLSEIIAAVKR